MAVTWPLPVDSVTGPSFKHSQLAAVIVAADPTYPQYRFKSDETANIAVVYTAAESSALGAGWTNSPGF